MVDDRVDVVIVTYQSARHLGPCLESLLSQEALGEIVVVDNGSTDETGLVAAAHPSVRWVPTETNRGFGSAVNRGVALTSTDLAIVANADCVFDQGCIVALRTRFFENPNVAIVGPTIRSRDGTQYPSFRSFPGFFGGAAHALLAPFWRGNPWTRRYHNPTQVDWVSGTAMAVRRSMWEEIGGFDESYFMYVEDVDLCWRARRGGWDVAVEPTAGLVHEIGGSSTSAPIRLIGAHHRSAFRFWWRSTPARFRPLAPVVAGGLGARAAAAIARRSTTHRQGRAPH